MIMESYKSDDRFDQVIWGQDPQWIERMNRAHKLVTDLDYSHEHVWDDGSPVIDVDYTIVDEGDQL